MRDEGCAFFWAPLSLVVIVIMNTAPQKVMLYTSRVLNFMHDWRSGHDCRF
jgi:hypothetical protein